MIKAFLGDYWPYLIVGLCFLALVALTKYQGHVIDSQKATIALRDATIAQIDSVGKAQAKKAVETQENAKKAVDVVVSESQDEIARIKKYYETHPNIKYIPASGVYISSGSGSSTLSSIPKDSEAVSETRDATNSIPGERSLTGDCAEVTVWYTKIYRSWEAGCNEVECK